MLFGDLMSTIDLALLDLDYGLCMNGKVPLAEIHGTLPGFGDSEHATLRLAQNEHFANNFSSHHDMAHEMASHDHTMIDLESHDHAMLELATENNVMHDPMIQGHADENMSYVSSSYGHVLLHGFDHADVEVAILREADQNGRYRFDGLHTGSYALTRVLPTENGGWQAIAETENIFVRPGEVAEAVGFRQINSLNAVPNFWFASIDVTVSQLNPSNDSFAELASEVLMRAMKPGEATVAELEASGLEAAESVETDANLRFPEAENHDSSSTEGTVSGNVLLELDRVGRNADRAAIIGGVRVILEGVDGEGGNVRREALVDDSGRYLFEGVPAGKYDLSLDSAREATESEKREIEVIAGQELEIDLAIELKPLDLPVQSEVQFASWGWSENSLYLACSLLVGFSTTLLLEGFVDRARRGVYRTIAKRRQHWLQTSTSERA